MPTRWQISHNPAKALSFTRCISFFDAGQPHSHSLDCSQLPYTMVRHIAAERQKWLFPRFSVKFVRPEHLSIIPVLNIFYPWLRYNTHTGKHNELVGLDMKRSMEDLFFKYRVNVAFSGHVHAYERFLPIYKNLTNLNATIYMTVGTGGQDYGMQSYTFCRLLLTFLPPISLPSPSPDPLISSPYFCRL